MNIEPQFNYSPSFLRVIIPGISVVLFIIVIPSSMYLYFNNSTLFFQIIGDLTKFLLSGIIISIVIGLLFDSFERPIIRLIQGYYLQFPYVVDKMKNYQFNECIKLIDNYSLFKDENFFIKRDNVYELLFYHYSNFLYYIYNKDFTEDQIKSSLMPTTFGNIFKSIEVYPNWKYGIDGVFFWTRLLSNVSELDRKELDIKSAFVSMYADLCIIFSLTYFIFELMAIFSMGQSFAIIYSIAAFIFLICSILCYKYLLLNSTVSYGKLVRSMFDLHKNDLLKKFNLELMGINKNLDEKIKWTKIKEYLYYPTE